MAGKEFAENITLTMAAMLLLGALTVNLLVVCIGNWLVKECIVGTIALMLFSVLLTFGLTRVLLEAQYYGQLFVALPAAITTMSLLYTVLV